MIEKNRWKGSLTELAVAKDLMKNGYNVSFPYGENQRYDLVVEINNELKKVQCKTARLKGDSISFNCCGTNGNYKEDADYFGVYCLDIDKVYLIPVTCVGVREACLRLDEPMNKKYKKAKDFEIKTIRKDRLTVGQQS